MDLEQVLTTYDDTYARGYNQKFLNPDIEYCRNRINFEVEVLTKLLKEKGEEARWLDVACGTGYFLSIFPEVKRAGLDLSPAMLKVARENNPKIPLIEGNFLNKSLLGKGEWNIISSMWWAYSMVESLAKIEIFIENISDWLSENGVFFMPFCNIERELFMGALKLPYVISPEDPLFGGKLLLTSITWSWVESNGKRHDNMVVPQTEYIIEMFKKHFQSVEVVDYPNGIHNAIIARKKS